MCLLKVRIKAKSILLLDISVFILGPIGKDGVECPSHCPMKCGPEEMHCSGNMDFNGCSEPEMCIPAKGMYKWAFN